MKDMTFKNDFVGDVGWDVTNPMFLVKDRKVLRDQPHKWSFNRGGLRANYHMETTGYHAEHVDTWLGLPYHELDQLSLRE